MTIKRIPSDMIENRNTKVKLSDEIGVSNRKLEDVSTAYATTFKTDLNDWGQAINEAINSIGRGRVLLPAGDLTYTNPIIQKPMIEIIGQGIDVTVLKPVGCHGITAPLNDFFRFAKIKDLTIQGDNAGDLTIYDNTKNGINWDTTKEQYQCKIERVRVLNMKGKGVYSPYDFNNVYDEVFVSFCGGHGIEVAGLNTSTLKNCYVDYIAPGKVGYRVYQNAVLISCNGLGGSGDYWGVFGRNNGQFEDSNKGQSQYNIIFIGCNIEDWKKRGCTFLYSGGFQFISTTIYAPATGTFEYYIYAQNISKMSNIDGSSVFQSKGATKQFVETIYSDINNPQLQIYNGELKFENATGLSVKLPTNKVVYDSYLQNALEFDYANIKGMSYYYLGGKKHTFGTEIPTSGTWAVGDTIHNTNTTIGAWAGWKCITAGTPGTWRPFGQTGVRMIPTTSRPTLTINDIGYTYLDSTLSPNGKLVTWNGTNWVDATGTIV
ncbi:right-handed parallel beta-helix repeat-containing protein [Litchfieldia alkalitelluris]|uniref:right-handed parallel beta-helix repeat-containing protein n=1 Tax=Litchfieldia alkalitelluris TaxID=304268 RepID=UPI0009964D66|nr:right-handed parallel beta-helix repeat-containing protein [Litchfieldia alkalitelluris]